MSIDNYKEATKYEMIIRNVYGCPRGMRNGADLCFMKNAMSIEEGETYSKHLGSFEKQFKLVKSYIVKALEKASKTKPYSASQLFFTEQIQQVEYTTNTNHLMKVVNSCLAEVIRLRDTK